MVKELLENLDEKFIDSFVRRNHIEIISDDLYKALPNVTRKYDSDTMYMLLMAGHIKLSTLFILGFLIGLHYYETKELEKLSAKF